MCAPCAYPSGILFSWIAGLWSCSTGPETCAAVVTQIILRQLPPSLIRLPQSLCDTSQRLNTKLGPLPTLPRSCSELEPSHFRQGLCTNPHLRSQVSCTAPLQQLAASLAHTSRIQVGGSTLGCSRSQFTELLKQPVLHCRRSFSPRR